MSGFSFVGALPSSKSLFNRALLVQSFAPHLRLVGHSQADDVEAMRRALQQMKSHLPIDCGSAGTVLRFMALRAAREPGRHHLYGSKRLFERPQQELNKILSQLGCEVELTEEHLKLRSWGWKMVGDALHVPTDRSSQFASAVLLSAWDLPFELCMWLGPKPVSEGYLEMTLALVKRLGMNVQRGPNEIRVPRGQKVMADGLTVEPDLSSLFALAACAAVGGQIRVSGVPQDSLQPDRLFMPLLQKMGVPFHLDRGQLEVHRAEKMKAIEVDLTGAPDLFPGLAALAALAEGESHLKGATHLVYKESDRRSRIVELLRNCGRDVRVENDLVIIRGQRTPQLKQKLRFDPDQDHRLAFAAAILKLSGEPIEVLHPLVVNKSFPEFWQILGVAP